MANSPTSRAENLHDCYAWRLERRMVRVRWLAVPAGFAVLLLPARVSAPLIALLAGGLALGNLGIERLLRRARNSTHLRLTSALATGLEWGVAAGIVGACSDDLPRTVPAVMTTLLTLVAIGTARYGVVGLSGSLGGTIALCVLTVLIVYPGVGWRVLEAWVVAVVAPSAIIGGILAWLRQQLAAAEKRRQSALVLLRRLQEEERRWNDERVALKRMATRLSERESQILALVAREDLSYDEIARDLSVTADTVKTHVHRIGTKLGVQKRERWLIVAEARARGLLPSSTASAARGPQLTKLSTQELPKSST